MHRIGVFDSGIGGLTVLRQLRRAFPQLDMVYLGDTARVPYGGRSVETITHYAEDDVRFLLRKDVEAIVIACGTVSSNSLDVLREKFDLPIYGVIESAARLAASMTKTRSVGVIGTQATVKSGAYETHIRAIDPGIHVVSRACPLFVPLVENGIAPDDIVAETVCSRYMEAFDGENIDALIMGCTHYPVYRPALEKRLPGVRHCGLFSLKAAAPVRSNTTLRSAAPPSTRSSVSWTLRSTPPPSAWRTLLYSKTGKDGPFSLTKTAHFV